MCVYEWVYAIILQRQMCNRLASQAMRCNGALLWLVVATRLPRSGESQ